MKGNKKVVYRCAYSGGYCHLYSCPALVDRPDMKCPGCRVPRLLKRQVSFVFFFDGGGFCVGILADLWVQVRAIS
jgi:hypothetical protein